MKNITDSFVSLGHWSSAGSFSPHPPPSPFSASLSLYPLPLIFLPSLMDLVPLGFNFLVESVPQMELE
jgi:hypothetical protein